ncbi:excinuclease ABC subunit B [Thalassococcus sp. CAU 1522]|uniref:Excinuclease ABC subunit B n=1 Tax=Thalassococcus arenae TaxID=2851652 RepID=A0ABS6N7M5_9RHOB|nr:excinuclease ABC subunit B [Thalassococcus arenae]MBV2360006.1 excinuclease ABC subunit B [Thalassococcus arenae]
MAQATKVYRDALAEQRELEFTLARGYALETVVMPVQKYVWCDPPNAKPHFCWRTEGQAVTRRVKVDLNAVRARSAEISRRLPGLRDDANAGAAQCRATYPRD